MAHSDTYLHLSYGATTALKRAARRHTLTHTSTPTYIHTHTRADSAHTHTKTPSPLHKTGLKHGNQRQHSRKHAHSEEASID